VSRDRGLGRTGLAGAVALGIILVIGIAVLLLRSPLQPGGGGRFSGGDAGEGVGIDTVAPSEDASKTSLPTDGVRMHGGDGQGVSPGERATDGGGEIDPSGRGASLVPLGSGPPAGSAARWVPVSGGAPAAEPAATDAAADDSSPERTPLPAMSLYADSPVRVVTGDSSLSADSIARAVASRSWEELRSLVSSEVPRFVLDAARESLVDRGEVRWIHEIATNDDRAYLLGFPSSVLLLRLYVDDQIVVDLEIEEASLIGAPGGADTDNDVLSPR
jgi:hypothetical protein